MKKKIINQQEYLNVLESYNLPQENIHNISLTKAKIPTKTVVKLAVKNLWKKKFRYLVMLLVCAISLAFLSFTIELNGNPLRQNVFTAFCGTVLPNPSSPRNAYLLAVAPDWV